MQFLAILLQLAGAVMLLLYSTRMVRTGIERASGPALRNLFLTTRKSVTSSAAVGVLAAILLQSATAVTLIVAGFSSTGVMGVTGSLAVVLGADLGTALVVQFLSLDLDWLVPLLLTSGGILFLKTDARMKKQIGRILLGVAFILISLKMIGQATVPLRDNGSMPVIVQYLSSDIITAFLCGAALAFAFHSSVAAILLFAALCVENILPLGAALPLVLGANAGGALIPFWLTRTGHVRARRITTGNVLLRGGGALLVLALLTQLDLSEYLPGAGTARQLVNFHFFFNLALFVACLPFVVPFSKLMKSLITAEAQPENEPTTTTPSALDRALLKDPKQALASVTRELLNMAGVIEIMMAPVMDTFAEKNDELVERIRKMDSEVNANHTRIKLFLAELSQGALTPGQAERSMDLINFSIGLERVGDIVADDLTRLIERKHTASSEFSSAGWSELTNLHARVMANAQLALNVLVSEDVESARQLVEEKEKMRQLERRSHDRHVARLAKKTPESIATSDIHLETVRALKEINSLYAMFGYPTLRKYGELLESRLAGSNS